MSKNLSAYLITGAAGFIGSRFVESCSLQTIPTVCVDHLPLFAQRWSTENLDFGLKLACDTFFKTLADSVEKPQWEVPLPPIRAIIHLGALTDTRLPESALLRQYNLIYSQLLWKYATIHRIPFLYASSAATYGSPPPSGFDDSLPPSELKPLNPYGASKLAFDDWVLTEDDEGRSPPTWLGFKFFNVYGYGEQHKQFMASAILHAFEEALSLGHITLFRSHHPDYPDGHQSRDFIAVSDVIAVLHAALLQSVPSGIYNLGTGKRRTYLDIVRGIGQVLGRDLPICWQDTPQTIQKSYQYWTEANLDRLTAIGLARKWLSLEQGIQKYYQDLKKNLPQLFQKA